MIVITFSFLGKDVKVTVDDGIPINKNLEDNEYLLELLGLHEILLSRTSDKFKYAYQWCKSHCMGSFKRGRHTNFWF